MSNTFWIYFVIGAGALFLLILILVLINAIVTKRKTNKMFNDILNILNALKNKNKNIKIEKISHFKNDNLPYDFYIETEKYNYYIKVIPNYNDYEITINNSIKWQIRRSYTDESLNFVPGVEEFIRYDFAKENKENRKVFIIYPSSKSLLKYVNECEMEFVTPDTDIYGTKVYTYNTLLENNNIIEV